MTEDDAIIALCRLRSLVLREVFNYRVAADCFCSEKSYPSMRFQDGGEVLAFIRAAVVEKIAETKGRRRMGRVAMRKLDHRERGLVSSAPEPIDQGPMYLDPPCRRCGECAGEDHHWPEAENAAGEAVWACKHCEAEKPDEGEPPAPTADALTKEEP